MIQVSIDENQLKALYLEKVEERMKEIEQTVFFMNSKQLQTYLGMSWNTITTCLMVDEDFPKVRLGNQWRFPSHEVKVYMENYYEEVRRNGGNILEYRRPSQ